MPKRPKIQPLRLRCVCSLEFSVQDACPSSLARRVCFAFSHFSPKLETITTVGCGCLLTINRTTCGIGSSSFWSQLYIFSIKPEQAKLHTSLSGIKYTLKKLTHCSFICGMSFCGPRVFTLGGGVASTLQYKSTLLLPLPAGT